MLFFLSYPFLLGDPEIFLESSSLVSPVHIIPEWYFLFAYAILRAIPRKGWGVLFLDLSVLVPMLLFFNSSYLPPIRNITKTVVFFFLFNFIFLSWLGQCPVEFPYVILRVVCTIFYFTFTLVLIRLFVLDEFFK